MNRDELDALRLIANRHIQKIMDSLNMVYEERYQYIVAACPIHGGDRRDGFSWHIDFGMFQCFSRGCHERIGKDVYALVKGTLDLSFSDAVKYVKEICEKHHGAIDVSDTKHIVDTKKFVDQMKLKNRETRIYPEETLKHLRYHSYLESRNYPKELAESYQVGFTDRKYAEMSNRVIFPIRNANCQIVGFTGRTLDPDWKAKGIGKWRHSNGFDKEHNLFNIDRACKHIEETGTAILVEGALDVLRLEQAGIKNSVAIFGRKLFNGQIALLLSIGANRLIIAFDADNAGLTGAETAAKSASAFFEIVNFCPDGAKDVGDMSVEKIQELFNKLNKTESVRC